MDPTNKEILRLLQELIDITDRKLAARYDRMIETIDSCLTTGGTAPSSSTSAGSDVYGVADEPTPASLHPIAEVPTPASSDSDAKLVTINVDGPAAPAWATRSTGDPSRDTTESRSAPAPAKAPTVHMATVDIVPVLAAPAATDGILDGQAISGVASTPATCSMDCLPQQPVVALALVSSSPLKPIEYNLNNSNIPDAAVPQAMRCEFSFVLAFQMQQLYNDSELFKPISSQPIASNVHVHVHPPMPSPSFLDGHTNGDETRPLPWPSFCVICDCETPSDAVMKQSRHCISDSFHAKEPEHYFCSCQPRESAILNSMRWSLCSYDRFCCAIQDALCWHGNFVTALQMQLPEQDVYQYMALLLVQGLFILAAPTISSCNFVLSLGNMLADWHLLNQSILTRPANVCITEWVLTPWDLGQQVVLSDFTKVSCSQVFHCICLKKLMLQSIFLDHTLLTPHKPRPGAQGMRTMLPICESFEISCCCHIDGLDLHETIILTDSGSLFHTTVVLHIGKNSRNRQFAYSAISYDDLLLLIRSTALKYMKLYWLTTTVMTEVFRACFSLQIGVTHLAVHCNCLADRQLDLETKTAWYSAYNYCMMVMNNSSFMNLKLLGQSDDIHLQWWPLCIFPPTDELISKSGILVHEILPADCHWGNLTNQWLYFLWCDIPEADLSGLTICDVLLLHLEDMIHWQIAWQHTHDECRWYPNSKYSMMVVNNSATSALEAHVTAHLSVIEVYRHVLGLGVAYTQEFNTSTQGRVVVLYMPDVPVIIDLECQDLHKSDRAIPLTYSCSLFDATLLRFCGQAQPLGLLLQGGTHANLPSLVICKLKLQNHQDTMQMKKVGLPQFHAFVWHVGKGYHDWQFAHLAIARVHPVSLSVHAYQLGILASTMFSFAWGIFDCISLIAQGISAKLLNCRPSEASGDCGSLHKDTHEAESGCQWPLHFVWTCLSLFYDSSVANTLKKHPLPWDPVGMHLSTSLDRQIVFRFPWDPGIAAAAWGQAAFQGGRGVRVPTLHVPDELQILDELQVADTATRPKRAAKPNNKYFEPT